MRFQPLRQRPPWSFPAFPPCSRPPLLRLRSLFPHRLPFRLRSPSPHLRPSRRCLRMQDKPPLAVLHCPLCPPRSVLRRPRASVSEVPAQHRPMAYLASPRCAVRVESAWVGRPPRLREECASETGCRTAPSRRAPRCRYPRWAVAICRKPLPTEMETGTVTETASRRPSRLPAWRSRCRASRNRRPL